jgi:hypothetical protein
MRMTALMIALILAIFAFGCGEEGNNPAPAGDNGENGETTDTGDNNGTTSDVDVADFNYTAPEVGQWIAYGVEGEEGEFKLSVVAEEDACLWYQIEVNGEAVAQVLVDQALLGQLIDISGTKMDEFVADPVAFMEANMPENGDVMSNPEYIDNMMLFLESVKKVKINDGSQIMLLDMAGVPELVEQMLADNPDILNQNMQIGPEQTAEMEEFMAELEQASFTAEEVEIDGLSCTRFIAIHEEKGTIEAVISSELPIIPLMEARVTPNDPEEDGGVIMVTGYGFEGAENLMTGEPDQIIPVAMMLQGMASQFENSGAMPQ